MTMNVRGTSRLVEFRLRIGVLLCLRIVFWSLLLPVTNAQETGPLRPLQEFEQEIQGLASNTEGAVVAIAVIEKKNGSPPEQDQFERLLLPRSDQIPARVGVGAILEIRPQHILILTPAHLIEPILRQGPTARPFEILVHFCSRESAIAQVIAADPRSDFAVLQVACDDLPSGVDRLRAVKTALEYQPKKGAILVAIGDPWVISQEGSAGLGLGVVSNVARTPVIDSSRPLVERSLHELGTLMELELPANMKCSGTLLMSLDGELAGIVTALPVSSRNGMQSSYAIPLSSGMTRIIADLKQGFEIEYGFLGISPETSQPEDLAQFNFSDLQTTAAIVIRVATNSAAEKGGVLRDDLIFRVNDLIVQTSEDLIREIGLIPPEEQVELTLYRRNQGVKTVLVTLGKWPVYDDTTQLATRSRHPAWRGMEVDYSTGRRRFLRDRFLLRFPQGVAISKVEPNSPAALAGLQVGQFILKVNDHMVQTPGAFHQAVAEHGPLVRLELDNGSEVLISTAE